jgi:hypothetical protein
VSFLIAGDDNFQLRLISATNKCSTTIYIGYSSIYPINV